MITIGDDDPRGVGVTGEESHRMSGIQGERLIFAHSSQIIHHQPELSPVAEDLTVTTVCHQLVRKLGVGGRG